MTKEQLNNLIRFSFNFHYSMDSKLEDHNACYLLEKWNNYIGVKPTKELTINVEQVYTNPQLYNAHLVTWIKRWFDANSFDDVKHIINFILIINSKSFHNIGDNTKVWVPSQLIDIFEDNIGDSNLINGHEYKGLHRIVEAQVDKWLKYDDTINRDYQLSILT